MKINKKILLLWKNILRKYIKILFIVNLLSKKFIKLTHLIK